jgi:glutamate/tyrosine decarboxylase-like PLP-dependent enzyme
MADQGNVCGDICSVRQFVCQSLELFNATRRLLIKRSLTAKERAVLLPCNPEKNRPNAPASAIMTMKPVCSRAAEDHMDLEEFTRDPETLDPLDWDEAKRLGHKMIDDMLDSLRTIRGRPVWVPIPDHIRATFRTPVPLLPGGADKAYEEFLTTIFPFPRGNMHPRFLGWVSGPALVSSIFADLLASGFNSSAASPESSAALVESQVIEWLKDIFQFPKTSSGLLTSGCSVSNLLALTIALRAKAPFDVGADGMQQTSKRLTVYCSSEAHSSIYKAVEVLGIGSRNLRKVPVDSSYRINPILLEQQIRLDRNSSFEPVCVIGTAGTINTGSIDDLRTLAQISKTNGMWLHVDGAFGALAWLSEEMRVALCGLELADSLAFDLHKWMYLAADVGALLVKNGSIHKATFAHTPAYLSSLHHLPDADALTNFSDYGVELTRRFRALKVWFSIKEHGLVKIGRAIQRNIALARSFVTLLKEMNDLELVAEGPLQIVCFRYHPPGIDESHLNELNRELLVRLHGSGTAVPSHTVLDGKFVIRVAITNFKTTLDDLKLLLDEIQRIGKHLTREIGQGRYVHHVRG